MAKGIGAKVYIDGEKEFKQSVTNINAELRVMKAELGSVTSTFDKNNKSIQDTYNENKKLAEMLDTQEKKLAKAKEGLQNATKEYGETDKKTLAWRETIARTETEINKLNQKIDSNKQSMFEGAKATQEMSEGLTDLGNNSDSAGGQVIKLGDLIKANLISEAIIGGVKALGNAMKEVVSGAVDFAKEGVAYNSMLEDYETSFTTMTGSAEIAKEMMDDIKKTAKETPFEIDGMSDSVKQMMSYGIEGKKALELTKLLGDVSQGNGEKMNSMAYAMGQISSAGVLNGQDLRQLINAGFNPLEEISRTTGESMESLKDKMSKGQITYKQVEGALKSITGEGGRFEGAMINASKTFSGQSAMMEEGMNNLKGMVSESLFESLSGSVMPMINGWIDQLNEGFENDGIDGLINAVSEIIPQAMEFITEQLPMLLETGLGILQSLMDGIRENLPIIMDAVVEIVKSLITFIVENLPLIIDMGIEILFALIDGLIEALPTLIPAIFNLIGYIIVKIIENLPRIIAMGFELIGALISGLLGAVGDLLGNIGTIIGDVIGKIGEFLGDFFSKGGEILGELGSGLLNAVGGLLTSAGGIVSDLKDKFLSIDWIQVGKDIIGGIGNGIKSIGGWLVDRGKDAVGWLADGIKGFMGIQSPSKKMRDEVGKMMGLGLIEGFEDEMQHFNIDGSVPLDFTANRTINANLNNGQSKIDELIGLTQALLNKNQDIYLDTGALIGSTVGGMDLALSNNYVLKGRGR